MADEPAGTAVIRPQTGGMPGAAKIGASSLADIRIDFVQHSLRAWIYYYDLLAESPASY
jgi:hypothetical protein